MKLIEWLTNELCEMINEEYIQKNQTVHSENTVASVANSVVAQLAGSATTAIQGFNYLFSTDIPNENRDLKKRKLNSASILVIKLKRVIGETAIKKTTLESQGELLKVIKVELQGMQKLREQYNTDRGVYDSLLMVCQQAIEHISQMQEEYVIAFEKNPEQDKVVADEFYSLIQFILREYFTARINYLKYATPKASELNKTYSDAQSETLQILLKKHLESLWLLRENVDNFVQDPKQEKLLFISFRDVIHQIKNDISTRILRNLEALKDLNESLELRSKMISKKINAIEETQKSDKEKNDKKPANSLDSNPDNVSPIHSPQTILQTPSLKPIPLPLGVDGKRTIANDEITLSHEDFHQHLGYGNGNKGDGVDRKEEFEEMAQSVSGEGIKGDSHSRSNSQDEFLRKSIHDLLDGVGEEQNPSFQQSSTLVFGQNRPDNQDLIDEGKEATLLMADREAANRELAHQQKTSNGALLLSSKASTAVLVDIPTIANGHRKSGKATPNADKERSQELKQAGEESSQDKAKKGKRKTNNKH